MSIIKTQKALHRFCYGVFLFLFISVTNGLADTSFWSQGKEAYCIDPAIQPQYKLYDWEDSPPEDCPFEQSEEITQIRFTGRYANYTGADTWYLSWALDGNQYSTWTDGAMWIDRSVDHVDCRYCNPLRGVSPMNSWGATYPPDPQLYHCHSNVSPTCVGISKIIGNDPLNLDVRSMGKLYSGNSLYPCVSIVANDTYYVGSYSAYDNGGRFNGFRYSSDWDHFVEELTPGWTNSYWTDTRIEATDFFPTDTNPRRFNVPHAVVFGQNNELSPDGKIYLTAHGAIKGGMSNWDKGDGIYLCRVDSSASSVSNAAAYEFFSGHDQNGQPIWQNDVQNSKPILEWKGHLGSEGMTYIPALKKYVLITARLKEHESNLPYNVLIFWESDLITGPFKMIHYLKDWGPQAYFPNIPAKFIATDGKSMWLTVACNYSSGTYNPVQCRYAFSLHEIVLDMPENRWDGPIPAGENIAGNANANSNIANSNPSGINDGKRDTDSDYWLTSEGVGSWIRLDWETPQRINKIRIWDLPEVDRWVRQGTFTFSDGSTEKLLAWPSNRSYAPSEISFDTKEVEWVTFTIDVGDGSSMGLSEMEIYTVPDLKKPRIIKNP